MRRNAEQSQYIIALLHELDSVLFDIFWTGLCAPIDDMNTVMSTHPILAHVHVTHLTCRVKRHRLHESVRAMVCVCRWA